MSGGAIFIKSIYKLIINSTVFIKNNAIKLDGGAIFI